MITTVNYHIKKACNYSCKFCFAHFNGASETCADEHEKIVRMICGREDVRKINFVGGEPTLLGDELVKLIKIAKEGGLITSVTTNGSMLDEKWFEKVSGCLDMLTVSIDSSNAARNLEIGRATCKGVAPDKANYLRIAELCRKYGVQLKVNTVVCSYNKADSDMADLINAMAPFRWKVFQALSVEGENAATKDTFSVTREEFDAYVERHRALLQNPAIIVPESNELMTGSYIMIGPDGRFFDNTKGYYTKSDKIVEIGFDKALKQVNFDDDKFIRRGGEYDVPAMADSKDTEQNVEEPVAEENEAVAEQSIESSPKRMQSNREKLLKSRRITKNKKKAKAKKITNAVPPQESVLDGLSGKSYIGLFGKTSHFRERQIERDVDDYTLEKAISGIAVNTTGKMCLIAQPTYFQRKNVNYQADSLVIIIDLDRACLVTVFYIPDTKKYLLAKT
ncbi:MAG: viperin family antiviral radical SAM protein, partial [Bacteroidales bacterium]|nr:viperin family antiviral radical SAM protein [Bacteroidales bacterium]